MVDATDAARLRFDAALAELERKARLVAATPKAATKAAPGSASTGEDDDLFARVPGDPLNDERAVELEAAARDAVAALSEAAEALRGAMGTGIGETAR